LTQVDYLSDPSFTITGQATVLEQFVDGTNAFNLDGGFILFSPNASGGYNVQLVPPPSSSVAGANAKRAAAKANTQASGTRANTKAVLHENLMKGAFYAAF